MEKFHLSENEQKQLEQIHKFGFWGAIGLRTIKSSLLSLTIGFILGILLKFNDFGGWFYLLSLSIIIPMIISPIIDYRNLGMISKLHQAEQHLRALIRIDSLTGVYNKQAFLDIVRIELQNPASFPAALIFMDIDNFKRVNDNFGHMVGDQVLVQITDKLNALFRNRDVIGRFGGDEFVVYLPNANEELTAGFTHHINKGIPTIELDSTTIELSLSIGIEYLTAPGPELEELLARADENMYSNKHRT